MNNQTTNNTRKQIYYNSGTSSNVSYVLATIFFIIVILIIILVLYLIYKYFRKVNITKEVGYVAIQSNYGLMQFEPFNNVRDARTFEELDPEAQRFIHVIEKTLQVPIKYIGNGKVRDQMIVRN